mmetsp:Transcript_21741/g.43220  ORF Transcript_21741/g.43220 Transcript_21741/m.43220 type:complete len:141 (+) Transcript_21741:146-568(+)
MYGFGNRKMERMADLKRDADVLRSIRSPSDLGAGTPSRTLLSRSLILFPDSDPPLYRRAWHAGPASFPLLFSAWMFARSLSELEHWTSRALVHRLKHTTGGRAHAPLLGKQSRHQGKSVRRNKVRIQEEKETRMEEGRKE